MKHLLLSILLFSVVQCFAGKRMSVEAVSLLDSMFAVAENADKPFLVKFETSWCAHCKKLDRETLRNKHVRQYLADEYLIFELNADEFHILEIASFLEVDAYPTMLIYSARGRLREQMEGFYAPYYFLDRLKSNNY